MRERNVAYQRGLLEDVVERGECADLLTAEHAAHLRSEIRDAETEAAIEACWRTLHAEYRLVRQLEAVAR